MRRGGSVGIGFIPAFNVGDTRPSGYSAFHLQGTANAWQPIRSCEVYDSKGNAMMGFLPTAWLLAVGLGHERGVNMNLDLYVEFNLAAILYERGQRAAVESALAAAGMTMAAEPVRTRAVWDAAGIIFAQWPRATDE